MGANNLERDPDTVPQKQRRRRRRGPAELPGPPQTKYPFPVNIIFNAKLFYAFFIVVMIASMAAVGFGVSSSSNNKPPDIVTTDASPEATPDQQTWPDGPPPVIDTSVEHTAIIHTNQGDITIALSTDAPEAVNSFAFLAAKHFYNDLAFFFSNEYFAQAGDPGCGTNAERLCSGLGGPGYTLVLEDSGLSHTRGAVTAPSLGEGQDTVHGSQFRILLQDDTRLDGKDTVFGTVTDGMDIIDGLGSFEVCSISTSDTCQEDFSNALIIDSVEVN